MSVASRTCSTHTKIESWKILENWPKGLEGSKAGRLSGKKGRPLIGEVLGDGVNARKAGVVS